MCLKVEGTGSRGSRHRRAVSRRIVERHAGRPEEGPRVRVKEGASSTRRRRGEQAVDIVPVATVALRACRVVAVVVVVKRGFNECGGSRGSWGLDARQARSHVPLRCLDKVKEKEVLVSGAHESWNMPMSSRTVGAGGSVFDESSLAHGGMLGGCLCPCYCG